MKNFKTSALVFTFLFATQAYAQTTTSNQLRVDSLVWKADLTSAYKNTQVIVSSKTGLAYTLTDATQAFSNGQGIVLTQQSLSTDEFVVPHSTWAFVSSNNTDAANVVFNNKPVHIDPNALSDLNTSDSVSISMDLPKQQQTLKQSNIVLSVINRQDV